jgi:NAD(P)-dependent dehydrogenase (short-subunit alcohol dehydrogenase family)
MATAIVTGASMGLGEALAGGLARAGWSLVIDARNPGPLAAAAETLRKELQPGAELRVVPGDVTDASHRADLIRAAEDVGGLELVLNNASTLGASPLPSLTGYPLERLRDAYETNVVGPLALIQAAAPALRRARRAVVINITSDAAVEPYPGWGGYGSTKAALEQVSAVLGAEEPAWRVWAVDPGDLRTRMHQEAFPGEDISDRPEPESVVPALLALVDSDRPSGRVRLADLPATDVPATDVPATDVPATDGIVAGGIVAGGSGR